MRIHELFAISTCAAAVLAVSPARAETGVTDSEIILGQAAVFSGPTAGLGVEMWRGAMAAFSAANAGGGVHGRSVRLVLADDGYDAEKAAGAVTRLIEKERVFALFGGVGTPTISRALPVVLEHFKTDKLFYFASFSGAQVQREPPYDKVVFNVRASYREEIKAMIDVLFEVGRQRIGVFIQDDAYGASGLDAVKLRMKDLGSAPLAEARYPRGQKYDVSVMEQVKVLKKAELDAIISVGAYPACAALIRDVRSIGWQVPIHNVSFVGADQLLNLLREEEKNGKAPIPGLTSNLFITQVVPHYDNLDLPGVAAYRSAMETYNPGAPPIGDKSYTPASKYSFGSFEGYLSARAFLQVLDKAGKKLTRERFITAAESMGMFDLGVGVAAKLSAQQRQALTSVWFTHATPKGWVWIETPKPLIRL